MSNFLLAWAFLAGGGGAVRLLDAIFWTSPIWLVRLVYYLAQFLVNAAVLSVGLGIFNLFPIPPLDGSKVLFALLPDRAYNTILRYERYGMVLMLAAVWLGWLDKPLTFLISHVTNFLCALSGFPYPLF